MYVGSHVESRGEYFTSDQGNTRTGTRVLSPFLRQLLNTHAQAAGELNQNIALAHFGVHVLCRVEKLDYTKLDVSSHSFFGAFWIRFTLTAAFFRSRSWCSIGMIYF